MSRTRGYTTYRGRGSFPFWKGVAAVVLLSVILASTGILFLQRSMDFDGFGRARLALSDGQSHDAEALPPITIGPSEDAEAPDGGEPSGEAEASAPESAPPAPGDGWREMKAYRVQAAPLNMAVYWDMDAIVAAGGYDAVSVTLKDETGTIYFNAESGLEGSRRYSAETEQALRRLTSSGRHTIARMACFHDPYAANANVNRYGLKNTGGYIFFDLFEGDARSNWIDPAKTDARAYLCDLAVEIAGLGFDEILLTTVGYPPVGQLDKIAYGPAPIGDNLTAFLAEMRAALAPYGVTLSVEVPRAVMFGEGDASGLTLEICAAWADRLYASVEPDSAAAEIATGNQRAAALGDGSLAFIPELWSLPDPAPKRYLLASA